MACFDGLFHISTHISMGKFISVRAIASTDMNLPMLNGVLIWNKACIVVVYHISSKYLEQLLTAGFFPEPYSRTNCRTVNLKLGL